MPSFECKIMTAQGQVVTQVLEGANEQSVSRELIKNGSRPISIKKRKDQKGGGGEIGLFAKKIKVDEIVLFTRQLVTLLKAGVPMLTALEALGNQSTSQLGEILKKVYVDVMSGKSFSQALDQHPKVFSKLFVNSVYAGEMSGALDEVLERMAVVLKKDEETKRQVKGALKYPIFVVLAMVGAFIILMTFVVPKFAGIFEGFGMELPIFTRILIGTSRFVEKNVLAILGTMAGFFIGIQILLKNSRGRALWDAQIMKVPLVGPLVTKSAMARFTKMFETLNRSGLPILQSLNTVSGAVGNIAIEKKIKEVAIGVERGEGISGAMKKSGLFPPMVIRMISIGEQSGSLDDMLNSISSHYDMEVEYAIKGLTSMIEPIMTLALGGAVVVMAFGIFLPMWGMTGAVQ
ncbi:MAG TPA: type II secretion system F family protein [bacterium]|nr:type II secretion system F family protein [bacterium]